MMALAPGVPSPRLLMMTIAQKKLWQRIQELRRINNPQYIDLLSIYKKLFGQTPSEEETSEKS